jgi:hypothetical protein
MSYTFSGVGLLSIVFSSLGIDTSVNPNGEVCVYYGFPFFKKLLFSYSILVANTKIEYLLRYYHKSEISLAIFNFIKQFYYVYYNIYEQYSYKNFLSLN